MTGDRGLGGDGPTPTDDRPTPTDDRPTPTDDPSADAAPATPRPLIERIGLAFIALVLALMFGGVSAASWAGGEPFLAVMGGVGCLMTVWVGVITLLRG